MSIQEHHNRVAQRIAAGESGWAQSSVGDVLVSYDATGWPASLTHAPLDPGISGRHDDIVEEIILDVARGEGIASQKAFRRKRVEWMIANREAFPKTFPKKHSEAQVLATLLEQRPELFL